MGRGCPLLACSGLVNLHLVFFGLLGFVCFVFDFASPMQPTASFV